MTKNGSISKNELQLQIYFHKLNHSPLPPKKNNNSLARTKIENFAKKIRNVKNSGELRQKE